jgi:two-component system, response regulator, stage 0 sporulation protein F
MNTTDEAQPSSPTRILLAEDDGDLRMLLSLKLRGAGFDVTEASDGQDLLERLIDGYSPDGAYDPFDMVLSDINMPHFNALDVMVGARSCLTTTPIVLMTSFGDAHTHALALRLGATAVLDKPLRLDDLSATLVQILSQSGLGPGRPH